MGDITGVNGSSIINSQQTDEVKNSIASRGDSVLSGGIAVLYMFMNLLSEMADAKYSQMQDKADVSREAQSKANEMDEKNSNLSFEREFGKIIGRTDYFAYALSEKSERGITRALQSIATGIFLPF